MTPPVTSELKPDFLSPPSSTIAGILDADYDMCEDAQAQLEILIRAFPIAFARASDISPAAQAEVLSTLGNNCFLLASAFFQRAGSPLFGLAWSAHFAGATEELEEILPKEDSDYEKTKQLLVDLCQNRIATIHSVLAEHNSAALAEEIFAAWRSGQEPVGLFVNTRFAEPSSIPAQVEIGAPITHELRALQANLPRLHTLELEPRGMVYADFALLCHIAAAGYCVQSNSLPAFVHVLATLDIIDAVVAVSEPMLPLLAAHYAALAERCTFANAYPFVFQPPESD